MDDPVERRTQILDLLLRRQYATVAELSSRLGVSDSTVRRDLQTLESNGQVRRDHGGATVLDAPGLCPEYAARARLSAAEKRSVARVAAQMVDDHSVIGLDGSSTAYYLARCLAGRNITVVTNGIYSALELASKLPTRVILIGGELWLGVGCTIGHTGRIMLGRNRADGLRMRQFFTAPGGLTVADGLMDSDPDENQIKEDMIALADQVIALADHTKLGHRALLPYAPLSAVHTLITDDRADAAYVRELEEAGLRVRLATLSPADSGQ
jgi:DeoR/GlpR family transcriptional regulator of sugar metabolism